MVICLNFDDMFSLFDTIPACDGRTDRQTDICDGIVSTYAEHRALKTVYFTCLIIRRR